MIAQEAWIIKWYLIKLPGFRDHNLIKDQIILWTTMCLGNFNRQVVTGNILPISKNSISIEVRWIGLNQWTSYIPLKEYKCLQKLIPLCKIIQIKHPFIMKILKKIMNTNHQNFVGNSTLKLIGLKVTFIKLNTKEPNKKIPPIKSNLKSSN